MVGCGCRYCKVKCSILVAVCHGQVFSWFVFEVLLRDVCVCRVFVIVGRLVGLCEV